MTKHIRHECPHCGRVKKCKDGCVLGTGEAEGDVLDVNCPRCNELYDEAVQIYADEDMRYQYVQQELSSDRETPTTSDKWIDA